jgi:tetratricopeptide (TPR) repeat protein
MTSSDAHTSRGGASRAAIQAEALKEQGNAKLEQRAFEEAATLYTKGLALEPSAALQATLLANRAAARMLLQDPLGAADDCREAIGRDPLHLKAHARLAQALAQAGRLGDAESHLARAITSLRTGGEQDGPDETAAKLSASLEEEHARYEQRMLCAAESTLRAALSKRTLSSFDVSCSASFLALADSANLLLSLASFD